MSSKHNFIVHVSVLGDVLGEACDFSVQSCSFFYIWFQPYNGGIVPFIAR